MKIADGASLCDHLSVKKNHFDTFGVPPFRKSASRSLKKNRRFTLIGVEEPFVDEPEG